MAVQIQALLKLFVPLAAAVGAYVLGSSFVAPGLDPSMSRGMVGPATWPKAMLYFAAICAAGLFLQGLLTVRAPPSEAEAQSGPGEYAELRSLGAIGLLLAYGLSIPLLGIAWSTLAFVAAWLVLGGFRRPLTVVLVSTLGTVGILYLFVKLSVMPLDRGVGWVEQATIALYRLLGIY